MKRKNVHIAWENDVLFVYWLNEMYKTAVSYETHENLLA